MKIQKPETLGDAVDLFRNRRVQLCLGSRAGFFFVGTAAEFDRDVELLEARYKIKRYIDQSTWIPFRNRTVKRWYRRNVPREPLPQIAVIVEGDEIGDCICWEEYVKRLPGYYDEYSANHEIDDNAMIPQAWQKAPKIPKPNPSTVEHPELLMNAIIVRATNDYKSLYRAQLKRYKTLKKPKKDREMEQIEKFLSAGEAMSRVPAKLRKIVEEELQRGG